jgi:hypothetical protein
MAAPAILQLPWHAVRRQQQQQLQRQQWQQQSPWMV